MIMKKIFYGAAALALFVSFVSVIVSCGSSSSPSSPAATPSPTPTATPCGGTFGQPVTVGGTGYDNFGTGYTWYSGFSLSQSEAVTAIAVNLPSSSTQLQVAIYSNSGTFPQSLIANSTPVTTSASGVVTVGFGPVTLTAATYWLALAIPSTSASGLVGTNNSLTNLYGSNTILPATFTNNNSQSYEMSIVALYTCP
jgi:hypothetical protein